jgi:hypothetical protein
VFAEVYFGNFTNFDIQRDQQSAFPRCDDGPKNHQWQPDFGDFHPQYSVDVGWLPLD